MVGVHALRIMLDRRVEIRQGLVVVGLLQVDGTSGEITLRLVWSDSDRLGALGQCLVDLFSPGMDPGPSQAEAIILDAESGSGLEIGHRLVEIVLECVDLAPVEQRATVAGIELDHAVVIGQGLRVVVTDVMQVAAE